MIFKPICLNISQHVTKRYDHNSIHISNRNFIKKNTNRFEIFLALNNEYQLLLENFSFPSALITKTFKVDDDDEVHSLADNFVQIPPGELLMMH